MDFLCSVSEVIAADLCLSFAGFNPVIVGVLWHHRQWAITFSRVAHIVKVAATAEGLCVIRILSLFSKVLRILYCVSTVQIAFPFDVSVLRLFG